MFKTLLLIGTGGFIGSISRYLLTRFITIQWPSSFPYGTLAVNAVGCLFLGIIMGLAFQSAIKTQTRLLLAAGFCGGFTTFSSYSLEIFELYQRGEAAAGLLYMVVSILAGLLSIGIGMWLGRLIHTG